MKQKAKNFIALAAPSGGGKTTLCQMLLKRYPRTRLSVSHTTRAPRPNEKHGQDYFFVTLQEFRKLADTGHMAEWAEVHGSFYGTGKDFLEQQRDAGKIVLLDIDVQGVESLKRAYPSETFSVFINPPSIEELEQRLRARKTEDEAKLQERLRNAAAEIARAGICDTQLVNHSLEATFAELCHVLEREAGLVE